MISFSNRACVDGTGSKLLLCALSRFVLLRCVLLKADSTVETTATELGHMLYWLMVGGYSLRTMEVRFEMDVALLGGRNSPELSS